MGGMLKAEIWRWSVAVCVGKPVMEVTGMTESVF